MKRVRILNVNIDAATRQEASEHLEKLFEAKVPAIICTPNTEIVIKAQDDPELLEILNIVSKLNIPDGIGIVWAARFLSLKAPSTPYLRQVIICLQWILTVIGLPLFPHLFRAPIPERIPGSEFIWDVVNFAKEHKHKVFLLGGGPTVAERCALELQTKLPELRVAGVYSGSPAETAKIIEIVRKSKADILLLAFGAPKQEKWLSANLAKTGCRIGIGLGGTFDFIAGVRKRAPRWVQRIGFEWLYRLAQEPKRLVRQLAIPMFMFKVLGAKMKGGPRDS